MKFGEVPIDEAAGAVLAHSVRAAEGKFPKGRRLSQDDIAALRKTGIASVIVARLSPGDLMEDEAAARLAAAGVCLGEDGVRPQILGLDELSPDVAWVDLLHALPPRKVPPKYDPPLRRIAAKQAAEAAAT